ncbi:hypothetical protein ALC60_04900 [Trachymyrmex zeteki]|uniref:Uncharacterized protein n=1 Tax=Mycetomoellerius zeteki TaxID=64791 RepID=A0A151X710_9HYME|nr:hypothetical protein ALC60_04900 [Trachymyrmex zeteki]
MNNDGDVDTDEDNCDLDYRAAGNLILKTTKAKVYLQHNDDELELKRLDLDADTRPTKTIKTMTMTTTATTTITTATRMATMLLPGRGRGGERRPNYTRYRPTSKEPTVPLLSEPSPPNGQPENNAPLPRIPQSPGGQRRPDCAFDTLPLFLSRLSFLFPLGLFPSLALREYPLLSLIVGSSAVAELVLRSRVLALHYQIILAERVDVFVRTRTRHT